MNVESVTFFEALLGGFSAFFSAWQLCIMQISPFFIAFSVGLYLVNSRGEKISVPAIISLLLAGISFIIGFSTLFGLLGISSLTISSYLKYNLGTYKIISAIIVLLIAFLFIYAGALQRSSIRFSLSIPMGLLIGFALAFSYSPCITPIMSRIMNFAIQSGKATEGFFHLFTYGIGMSIAFNVVGFLIALGAAFVFSGRQGRAAGIILSSLFLSLLSFFILFGFMRDYKALLVGMFM